MMSHPDDVIPSPSLPLEELRQGIREIQGLDLRAVSIDELKRRVSAPLSGYGHAVPDIDPNQYVYRARRFRNLPKPSHVSELLYPPPASVAYNQRVNRAGTSMFYCCAIPECTYYEIGAERDDCVVLSKWQFARAPRLNHIGFTQQIFQRLGSQRLCPDFSGKIARIKHPLIHPETNALIDAFIGEAFTVEVEQGRNDYQYKLSIAIAELYLSGAIDGLWYPTVAMRADADNCAFTPAYVG